MTCALSLRCARTIVAPIAAASWLVLAAAPAWAQRLGQGVDDGISTWRVIAVLLLCLGLAVAGAFALRHRMGIGGPLVLFAPKQDRRLKLVESLRLSHQADIYIVSCDDRELLLLTSPQGAHFLDRPAQSTTSTEPRA